MQVHQVITFMLHTAEINMATSVAPSDIDAFLTNAAWAIHSTYHTVLKACPGAAIFGWDMLFEILFLADWNKIGDHRQHTKLTTTWYGKIAHVMIGIKKLVINYFLEKMISSAKVKVGMNVILGLSHQFIQVRLSGFHAEQNLKD